MIPVLTKTLKEVCKFISGGTPDTKIQRYFRGDTPWITGADIADNVITKPRNYITQEAIDSSATSVIPPNNVVLVTRTGVGKVAITRENICISQDFTGLIPNREKLDCRYLFFYLLNQKSYFVENQRGATIQGVTRDVVANLSIPLPPLDEQKRIAAILAKADRLRRLRRFALDMSGDYLQAVFLEMFGDPVTNPMGWKVKELGKLGDVQGGIQISSKRYELELEAPYLRVANVFRNSLDVSEIKTLKLTPNEFERTELQKGDLLLVEGHGNIDEIGRAAVWDGSLPGIVHQNHLIRVRPKQEIFKPLFAGHYLNSVAGKQYFRNASNTTSGLNTISTGIVKQCPCIVPPPEKQDDFLQIVRQHERLRTQQREALRQADHLFQTLLHQAFAGEL